MTTRNSGRALERTIALANQALLDEGLGVVIRVPTHTHGGIPSREPKVDFIGVLDGHPWGRGVMFEAKSGTGKLTRTQKALLAAADHCGALCFVHREDRLVMMDGSEIDLAGRTWWQAIQEEK